MMNQYGLDLGKTVFVIDSPITAFMVSILSEGKPVSLVLEKKDGLETEKAFDLLLNFVRSSIEVNKIKTVQLPDRFYIGVKDFRKIWNIHQRTCDLYDAYSFDTVFVGASTSTFMRSLRRRFKNIVYLYHGTTDLVRKEDEFKCRSGIKGMLKSILIGNIIGLPYSTWCNFWPQRAFSLCKLRSDDEKWLDLYDFHSEKIEKSLSFFKDFPDDKKNVLFFPVIEGHTKGGVKSDVTSFDDFNFNFLSRHIDENYERIFVKYHPWLYRANDNTRSNFVSLLNNYGIEAYDIATMIPDDVGGVLLPTEAICRYASIDKMIAQETSTMWYLSENDRIEKIIDIRDSPSEYRECVIHCIEGLKRKTNSGNIKFYI